MKRGSKISRHFPRHSKVVKHFLAARLLTDAEQQMGTIGVKHLWRGGSG
jgi:hypothetical protein